MDGMDEMDYMDNARVLLCGFLGLVRTFCQMLKPPEDHRRDARAPQSLSRLCVFDYLIVSVDSNRQDGTF